jgi:hypothetical protein
MEIEEEENVPLYPQLNVPLDDIDSNDRKILDPDVIKKYKKHVSSWNEKTEVKTVKEQVYKILAMIGKPIGFLIQSEGEIENISKTGLIVFLQAELTKTNVKEKTLFPTSGFGGFRQELNELYNIQPDHMVAISFIPYILDVSEDFPEQTQAFWGTYVRQLLILLKPKIIVVCNKESIQMMNFIGRHSMTTNTRLIEVTEGKPIANPAKIAGILKHDTKPPQMCVGAQRVATVFAIHHPYYLSELHNQDENEKQTDTLKRIANLCCPPQASFFTMKSRSGKEFEAILKRNKNAKK